MIIYARKPESIKKLAKIALVNKLWVHGWTLRGWLCNPQDIDCIAVLKKNNNYIGVAVIRKRSCGRSYCNTGVFVRNTERRKGYGSKILNCVKKHSTVTEILHDNHIFYRNIKESNANFSHPPN